MGYGPKGVRIREVPLYVVHTVHHVMIKMRHHVIEMHRSVLRFFGCYYYHHYSYYYYSCARSMVS